MSVIYTPDQLAHLDPVAISGASPRHIQSVLESLIATAQNPNAVHTERKACADECRRLHDLSRNSMVRSALYMAAANIDSRGLPA